jgi:hypothetical protein
MKSFLLSFNAYDFSKNEKVWTTQAIDLYANDYYTNFSNKRSRTGLNVLGDYKFVGTEKTGDVFFYINSTEYASPSYLYLNDTPEASPTFLVYTDPNFANYTLATPTVQNSVYQTNYGEIVSDAATPNLLRFVDTSSRIDIRSFKGAFTNTYGGIEQVNYSLNVYESDSLERTMASLYYYYFKFFWFYTLST